MIRHIILWTLKKELTNEEKSAVKSSAKEQLEGLFGTVPSLQGIQVHIDPLPSSNCDMMLDAVFCDAKGLEEYSTHPAHVAAADRYVRPYVAERKCMDFKE